MLKPPLPHPPILAAMWNQPATLHSWPGKLRIIRTKPWRWLVKLCKEAVVQGAVWMVPWYKGW